MKKHIFSFHVLLIFFLLLLLVTNNNVSYMINITAAAATRDFPNNNNIPIHSVLLSDEQGRNEEASHNNMNIDVAAHAGNVEGDMEDLMGLMELHQEDCEDEECEKRRLISEAHLDYIYTQHHHHKP